MSKSISGHFHGTVGSDNWNTSIVWDNIIETQGNYGGTDLPKSFVVTTPQGFMWTHNNATKHMHEAILSLKDDPKMKNTNPKLYTQFILYEYRCALRQAVKKEIKYEKKVYSGNWEFIFSRPRTPGHDPVIKHAKFTGLS
jgi:hypothetical protein